MVMHMKNGKVFVWMQMLGFERNDPDRGAQRFIDQTGFVPDGVVALLCHPDFFHHHRGMDKEYQLHPDNCAYNAIPRNAERERQPWTNWDLRKLAESLKAQGTNLYAGIFGGNKFNAFHQEWHTEHPEILTPSKASHFILKRFKDGTYYEDFFIDKVCQTLTDYGLKGIHMGDSFCPLDDNNAMLYCNDYSTDFVGQFLDHSGVVLPEHVAATMGDDSPKAIEIRSEWIYNNRRALWAEFNAWRWEVFFSKLCSRVHAIGKEVLALAMYCTDPFETLYCLGIDLSRIVRAGLDYLTANILPASAYIVGKDDRPYFFHKYMAIASTTAAHLDKGHLVSMLGLQDATEQWSAMSDVPTLHVKDMYTMMAYQLIDRDGISRALDGLFLCLGDGIPRQDWDWERERLEIALSADAQKCISPAMLWSAFAFDGMMEEYINTRRWTPHKLFYELAKSGAHCAATVKPDGLCHYSGTLVVPNFDMLSEEEKAAVTAYDRGSVFCTANPDFDPAAYGIQPEILFRDQFSDYSMTVFAYNCKVDEEVRAEIATLIAEDDGKPNLVGDVRFQKEPNRILWDTLVFAKVTEGFQKAMALLLNNISNSPFKIDKPNIILQMKDGAYRIYLFNDHMLKYKHAFVISEKEIKKTKIVSKYPVLPPRYMEESTGSLHFDYSKQVQVKKSFEIKIQPGGVTIIDVYC